MPEPHSADAEPERRLSRLLKGLWTDDPERNFERLFILVVLLSVGVLGAFVDDKLAFLDFYFLPVLMAGYFLNLRSAVLGSVLSILWVGFGVIINPESFYLPPTPQTLYLHLVAWGGFLILCGALVGRLNEQLLEKFARLKQVLAHWRATQSKLDDAHRSLEERHESLDSLRNRFESVLFSSMDSVTAQLAVQDRLPTGTRQATVLRAELAGAAKDASSLKAEEWFSEANQSLSLISPAVAAFHGRFDRLDGAGLQAEFGLTLSSPHSAVLGVMAALRMQEKAKERRGRWPLKVSLSKGPVAAGLLGGDGHRSFTVVGPAVDEAARLNSLCGPDKVCVSTAIHQEISGGFHTRPALGKNAGGKDLREELLKIEARIDYSSGELQDYLEAGRLCSEMGDHDRSQAYYVMALRLNPPARREVESRIAQARAQAAIAVRESPASKEQGAFEVLGLRDPLDEPTIVPARVRGTTEHLFARLGTRRDLLLPLEALKGSLGHSQVCAVLTAALASAMGLGDEEVRAAFTAGFFHEIGLRNLPGSVADKDEYMPNLPPRDLEVLLGHPSHAESALRDLGIEVPALALEAVRQHRENLDGSGPQRLPAGAISLLARALRVAHEYDRLTGWRPFRKAWTQPAAISAMRLDAEVNHKLDPKILDVFEGSLLRRGGKD